MPDLVGQLPRLPKRHQRHCQSSASSPIIGAICRRHKGQASAAPLTVLLLALAPEAETAAAVFLMMRFTLHPSNNPETAFEQGRGFIRYGDTRLLT